MPPPNEKTGGPSLSHRSVQTSLRSDLVDWICTLADWNTFHTGTFEGEFSEWSAHRAFERWCRRMIPDRPWFYVTEPNNHRAGHHIHTLMDLGNARRKPLWSDWFRRYGRNKVEPVKSRDDVAGYLSKHAASYLVKGTGWFNVNISASYECHLML